MRLYFHRHQHYIVDGLHPLKFALPPSAFQLLERGPNLYLTETGIGSSPGCNSALNVLMRLYTRRSGFEVDDFSASPEKIGGTNVAITGGREGGNCTGAEVRYATGEGFGMYGVSKRGFGGAGLLIVKGGSLGNPGNIGGNFIVGEGQRLVHEGQG